MTDRPSWWIGGAEQKRYRIEFRSDKPRSEIELWPAAKEAIVEMARASRDGTETGGVLLGPATHSWGTPAIRLATGPGPKANRAATWLQADAEHDLTVIDQWHRNSDGGVGEVGCWHTHPLAGYTLPSDTDMQGWATLLELADRRRITSRWVGLIVSPSRFAADEFGRWTQPQISAYVLRRSERTYGPLVVERAVIR